VSLASWAVAKADVASDRACSAFPSMAFAVERASAASAAALSAVCCIVVI